MRHVGEEEAGAHAKALVIAAATEHGLRTCARVAQVRTAKTWHAQLSRDRDMAERAHSFFFAHVLAHPEVAQ